MFSDMSFSNEELIQGVLDGNYRAVARLISLSENRVPRARDIQAELFKKSGSAHVIGVTGSPGAGKSTLVDRMALSLKQSGKKVAVLAVDPTSPFSGGAVLGDRIRMNHSLEHEDIYVRSMATRGSLGGLSKATLDAIQILDAAGFEAILVETVGVGQAEVDIMRTADTCFVVLVPGMGDSVQAIKAGILEIADHFVINKSDRDGADLLQRDIRILLSLSDYDETDWKPPILRTVATTGDGVEELLSELSKHQKWLAGSQEGKKRKLSIIKERILRLAADLMYERLLKSSSVTLDDLVQECFERKKDPYSIVEALLMKADISSKVNS